MAETALTAARRHLLFHEWNDSARDYPLAPLIHELAAEWARLTPKAVAVADGGRRITYGDLDARANGLARRLQALGVGPEKRVAILASRSIEMVLGALAVLKAGACYVPVDPRFPQERRAFMLEDSRAAVVLAHPDQAPELAASAVPVIRLDVEEIPREAEPPRSAAGPENLAYVIYTSGSTGRPKGAEIEHASLIRLIRWHLETYRFAPGDRATLFSGPSFDVSVWEVWSCLAAGASLHIPDEECRSSAPRMIQWLASHEITHGVVSTPLAELMIGEPWPAGIPLRTLTTGGDRLHQWPGAGFPCPIYNIYGPTEGTVVTTCFVLYPGAGQEGLLPPIGRPLANIRVHVLDPDYRPVPPGESGELWIGGGGLGRGYLERPELTAEKFVPDPFAGEPGARLYRTGDLARYLPDGNLEFLGRIDFQIKIRGFRIEPGEIEAELVTLPGVREAAVLPHGGGPGGTRLVAYLAAAGPLLDTAGVREILGARLPEYMVPSAFVWLDALPLTPNGKVDRRALAALPVELAAATAYVAPRTEAERALAEIWAEVLGVERVGIRDPFLDLGGHSLLAVRVLSRVRHLFGVEVPVRALFEAPTVEALARAVEEALGGSGREGGMALPERPAELPLSFAQQRLWFLDRLQPGSSSYNMPMAYRLRGRLAPAALAGALSEIARRHEALRTRFAEGAAGAVQVIDPPAPPALPQIDLGGLPEPLRRAEEGRLLKAEALRPFDLARGPLLRPLLLRLAAGDWVLLLSMHHIVSDGWSMGVMLRELGALYGALLAGEPAPLPELPLQYADFALWQRRWLQGEALERPLSYWREQLAGHPPALELPTDRPRPARPALRGATAPVVLERDLAARLLAASRRQGVSPFMTTLAGFLALLHRYTGQTDLVVGTPAAGRSRVELESLIGFFINTLPLRVGAAGDPPFAELLGRARETALEAYAHAELPLERIVEELAPERGLSHSPLFQVIFELQTAPLEMPEVSGLEISELPLSNGAAKLDLTLILAETPEGTLAGDLEYDRELFDAATAQRMAGHLRTLLAGAVERPDLPLSGLPLLSEAERAELLEWNDTGKEYFEKSPWTPVHELLADHARRDPGALAVVSGDHRLTYGELDARSNRLAHELRALGVGPDVVVGVCAERTLERVVGIAAILKAGGAYASFDPGYPRERLALAMADARVPVLLTESRLLDRVPASTAMVICLDRDLERLAGDESRPPEVAADPDHLAYVIFTSGSTGRPKGVAVPHRGLSNLVRWHHETYGVTPEDVGTQMASPAFDVSVWELWPLLAAGAAQSIPDEETRLSPRRLVSWWKEAGITLAFLPTPLADGILSEEMPAGLPVRWLVVGGDRLHRSPRPGTPFRLSNIYGPAEHSVVTTMAIVPPGGRVTIGRALANTRVHVLDAHGAPVPVGVPGELYVAGAGLARGYLWRPELTAERFLPDPFGAPGGRMYRTGDLVRRLPDGDLEFLGRLDHQVKIRGMRVELGEIESVLGQAPGVREAVVLVPDGRLAAYVVAGEGETLAVEELRGLLEQKLPAYMVPQGWALLEALPLTPNGKVDRQALARAAVAWGAAEEDGDRVEPRTETERALAELWRELLGAGRVGVHDDFFALGGHSLLAIQVLSRVRQRLGAELELRELFNGPTVEELARAVERSRREEAGPELAAGRRPAGDLPLSFAQQRLWFLERLRPGTPVYNMPMAYRLRGALRPEALAAALDEIARRHEALRTRFAEGESGPAQRIDPPAPVGLPRVDLSALPEPLRAGEEGRLLREEARRPFDLERGPLLRPLLLRLAPEEWTLLLAMHHIVSDGWSMGVLLGELDALYGAALAGLPSPLPELPVQYADFALWQRERLRGEALEGELAWWRERLAGHPEALELPADRPRPAARSLRGASEPFHLGAAVAERLRALGREAGAPLFIPLLAGFQALLGRYTGQTDLLVGTPTAGRDRVELEGLIGFFVNTLVLRTDLSGDPTFGELLGRARETALGAYAHAEVPFERLVEELAPERDLGRTPLFQAMLSLQTAAGRPRIAGLAAEELALATGTAKLELTLALAETADGGLAGELEYDRDLFDAATARRMLGHLEILLAGAAASPAARLSDLPLLAAAERRTLLVDWNATAAPFPGERSVHSLFAERAAQAPEAVAVIAGGERITYGELDARADALAARLRAAGVGPETLVALCAERSIAWVVATLAILKAGGAYVPLDPTYPRERLAFLLADTAAPVLLTEERLAPALPAGAARVILLDGEAAEAPAMPAMPPLDEIGGDHLAYVIYTSGSTGRPKGVAVPHRAVLRLVLNTDYLQLGPGDCLAQTANAAFDAATFELWGPLLNGGSVAIFPLEVVLSPAALAAGLRRHGVRVMFLTTALLNQVAREAPGVFAALDVLLFGGEAADAEAVRAVLRDGPPRRLLHLYGPTENTTYSTWLEVGRLAETAATVPIGRPVANSTAYVLDAHLRPVPVGAHGALYVGGAGLARGYLNRPELTAERFVPAPFGAEAGLAPGERLYATGDLVRQLPDGNVEFLGRVDQQVKIRGFRIEPGEIEAALTGHPAVREAVVLALADGAAGKRLVAFLTAAGEAPGPAELREHLRSRLPDYMIPSAFVWLEALPLTPNGKVDRAALARLEVRTDLHEHVAPRTEAERAIAGVFREVFGLESVGIHDDFFALGGHSLLATQVVSRVRRLFGVELEIRALFEESTVEQLARRLELAGYGKDAAVPLGGSAGTSDHKSPWSPPRTPLEELMAEIWGEALGLDRVGLHDNFWSLGGRPPLAAEVLARVGGSFGIELPPQSLYDSPTIAAFTAALGEILLAEEADDLEPGGLEPIGMGEV